MVITKLNDNLKFFQLSEVAQRNGRDSKEIWIVIKDSVYDVTIFVDEHPGGPELIMQHAGRDCTKEFFNTGHSSEAMKLLKGLKIGEVVEVS